MIPVRSQWGRYNLPRCIYIHIYIIHTYSTYIHTCNIINIHIYMYHRILMMLCKPQTGLERRAPGSPASLGSSAFWADLSPSFLGKDCGWIAWGLWLNMFIWSLENGWIRFLWVVFSPLADGQKTQESPRTRWIMVFSHRQNVKMFWPGDR